MKARVSKAFDRNNMEADIWMIMIQKEKGSPYNVGLLNDQNKPYYTHHKEEAIEKCKELNKKFDSESTIKAVTCREEFEKGVEVFVSYNPIKVARELKDEFQQAIGKHFINNGVNKWDADLIPLKNFWKFKRT